MALLRERAGTPLVSVVCRRICKEHKHSTRRIDLAACAILAYSIASTVDPGLQLYWYEDLS